MPLKDFRVCQKPGCARLAVRYQNYCCREHSPKGMLYPNVRTVKSTTKLPGGRWNPSTLYGNGTVSGRGKDGLGSETKGPLNKESGTKITA